MKYVLSSRRVLIRALKTILVMDLSAEICNSFVLRPRLLLICRIVKYPPGYCNCRCLSCTYFQEIHAFVDCDQKHLHIEFDIIKYT